MFLAFLLDGLINAKHLLQRTLHKLLYGVKYLYGKLYDVEPTYTELKLTPPNNVGKALGQHVTKKLLGNDIESEEMKKLMNKYSKDRGGITADYNDGRDMFETRKTSPPKPGPISRRRTLDDLDEALEQLKRILEDRRK